MQQSAAAVPVRADEGRDARGVPLPGTRNSVYLSVLEVMFTMLEFIMGMVVARDVQRLVVETLTGVTPPEQPEWLQALIQLNSNVALAAWLLWRHDAWYLFRRPVAVSRMALWVCAAHAVGFGAMLAAQRAAGVELYSLANYTGVRAAADMLVLAPFREELVFRGAILGVFRKRFKASQTVRAALVSSVLFALIHLANFLAATEYSTTYVALQVGLGFLIGLFYSLRVARANALWETVLMHAVNNLFSSFLPLGTELDFTHPLVAVSLLATVAVYAALVAAALRDLRRA